MSRRNRFCSIARWRPSTRCSSARGSTRWSAAALLARDGWSVCVLERNDVAGGCIRTSTDLTLPGFTHEVLASWHPLFTGSAAYAELEGRADRARRRRTSTPTCPPGRPSPTARRRSSRARSRATWRSSTGSRPATVPPGSGSSTTFMAQRRPRLRDPLDRALVDGRPHARPQGAPPPRPPRPARVRRQHARQLPRLGLDDVRVRGCPRRPRAVGAAHGPRPRSGDVRVHDAGDRRRAAARRHAGARRRRRSPRRRAGGDRHGRGRRGAARRPTCEQILVANGRATGVRLTDGEVVAATRAVVANVTPTQLYGSLLGGSDVPAAVAEAAARFRYGRAEMQIHLALDEPPRWKGSDAERLARCPIVHVTPGLDGVSRAVNEAERGPAAGRGDDRLRPARRARPLARARRQVDPLDPAAGAAGGPGQGRRCRRARHRRRHLDATSSREAYADRIVARLGDSIENLGAATLKRVVVSPADLEALNRNLVGGDIYGGSCALDQNLLWRPLAEAPGHETAVAGPVAHRREHASRPGPRRRLRLSRREGADEASDHPAAPREAAGALVTLSLSEISTVGASFAEDVEAYAAAGFDAIGIWEFKLPPDDEANLALLAEHGLRVSVCVPEIPSVLPLAIAGHGGPRRRRRSASRRSRPRCARFAAYEPECVACLAGPLGDRTLDEGTDLLVDGLQRLGAVAREAGTWVGFEPVHREPAGRGGLRQQPRRGRRGAGARRRAAGRDPVRHLPRLGRPRGAARGSRPTSAASSACTSATGRRSTAPTACFPTRASPTRWSSSRRSSLAGWDGALDVEIFSTPELFWGLPVDEAARRAYAAAAALR